MHHIVLTSTRSIKTMIGLIVLTVILALITTRAAEPSMKTENTQGGYMGAAPYYTAHKGVLYCWDGTEWWYLQRPSIPAGHVHGMPTGQPENWRRVGGSRIRNHQRTPFTFRQQAVRPVMMEY